MSQSLFWLDDQQWAAIEPFMPRNRPGAPRKDDRRIISGIFHVLLSGCLWRECPKEYGPPTTVYNRFNRWSRKRFWTSMLEVLAAAGMVSDYLAINATYVKAKPLAFSGNGARRRRRVVLM